MICREDHRGLGQSIEDAREVEVRLTGNARNWQSIGVFTRNPDRGAIFAEHAIENYIFSLWPRASGDNRRAQQPSSVRGRLAAANKGCAGRRCTSGKKKEVSQ